MHPLRYGLHSWPLLHLVLSATPHVLQRAAGPHCQAQGSHCPRGLTPVPLLLAHGLLSGLHCSTGKQVTALCTRTPVCSARAVHTKFWQAHRATALSRLAGWLRACVLFFLKEGKGGQARQMLGLRPAMICQAARGFATRHCNSRASGTVSELAGSDALPYLRGHRRATSSSA